MTKPNKGLRSPLPTAKFLSFEPPEEGGGQSPSANSVGSAALKSSGRQSTPPRGGNGGDHVARGVEGNGLVRQAGLQASYVRYRFEATETACPTPGDSVVADRATIDAPEDGK